MLSQFELDILHKIDYAHNFEYPAVIVWTKHDGTVEMGPVRHRRETNGVTYYEASPFPGGWDTHVQESQIMVVRETGALVNEPMARAVINERDEYRRKTHRS